jgi:alpha-1,2-mannosyltransferase
VPGVWKRLQPAASVVIFIQWSWVIGLIVLALVTPLTADSTADWLVASAARNGADPFTGLRVLSEDFQVPYVSPAWVEVGDQAWIHPRTPAALLLLQPSTLLSPSKLVFVLGVVTLVGLGVMGVFQLSRIGGRPWHAGLMLASVLLVSAPIVRAIQFGSWSFLLALAIGGAWVSFRNHDGWLGGIAIGFAIALRLFPALLLLPLLLFRRVKASATAISSAFALNLIGAVTLDIPLSHALKNLFTAGETWIGINGNGSLVAQIQRSLGIPSLEIVAWLVALTAGYSWWLRRRGARFDLVFAVSVVAMLLISPLSWEHYDAMLIPVVAFLLGRGSPIVAKVTASMWLILMTAGFMARQPWEQAGLLASGITSLVGRVLLLGGLVYAALRKEDAGEQFVTGDGQVGLEGSFLKRSTA